ncbi:MAG: TonB-denpendent receptor [Flaviaesturariibacter sp.]|nr:TonB-denpendent receptor [Flaviaesturariibacter sp.]
MRRSLRFSILFFVAALFSVAAFAQGITLTGKVRNISSQEATPAVSIMVKGSTQGAFTDENGGFRLTVPKLPVTLIITSVGFETKEITVTDATAAIQVDIVPTSALGQEVVVAATRTPERILESPVTVEKMNSVTLRNVPSPSYYEAINNLKGVDMHTASLTFRTVTTRGFIASGNTRLNQLIDGMDNQAPGLNFAVGSVIGLTELDVDNIELLAGASSALYGSGGVNGTLLINSKNPFKYQGLSFQVKQGVMHLQDKVKSPSPYYDWTVRYAKSWKEKFGFKISSQFIKANDWEAYDYDNVRRTNVISKVVPGNRLSDPNYDGVNVYGDETTANIQAVAQSVQGQTRAGILAATGNTVDIVALMNASLPPNATPAQIGAFIALLPAPLQGSVSTLVPFYFGLRNNLIPNQNVSRTGYQERNLVDYNTVNYKITGGFYYKITPGIEASINSYVGTGTTVYTGADRYSLKGLKMAQHKLEVRSSNWFVRGYTTQENAGDSYNATALGRILNEKAKVSTTWYPEYTAVYFQARAAGASDYTANQTARAFADQGRLVEGTKAFNDAAAAIKSTPISQGGAKFLDKSDLWAAEGQLNVSEVGGFSKIVEVIAGTQWKQYVLNSEGTLFDDASGPIKISEYGGYAQLRKKFLQDALTLTAAGRYDKHTNFKGRFTPRLTAVLRVAPENNLRFSYQTAYRFPTNQDQYINLAVGSGILIGGLPQFQTKYNLVNNQAYTAESVAQYRGNPADASVLRKATFQELKPETAKSYEVGYKGVIAKKVYFDAYWYTSRYEDFLGRVAVIQSNNGTQAGLLNPSTTSTTNLSYIQSTNTTVKAYGWGLTAEWQLLRRFVVYGNVFSDKLRDVPANFATFFNAPKYRFNIGLRNENVYKNIGFNFVYKWQDENAYEGTFVTGTLPAFGTFDGQVSYKIPSTKSMIRIGGTNIANNYFRSGYGSPYVGGLYYVSFGYNIF